MILDLVASVAVVEKGEVIFNTENGQEVGDSLGF